MLDHDTTLERKKGSVPEQNKIDVHHHFVPSFYTKALQDAGGDPSGWHLPTWSPSSSLELMSSVGTSTAILSLTAPGTGIVDGQASRDLARQANEFAAKVRDSDPSKFGFFASLPSLLDVEGSLTEIAHAYDFLKTDGVTLFTRYGNDYLGSPKFASIWSELNKRAAVVFIHPTHSANSNFVNPELPQPVIDYPHETTRTAVDLIMSNTKRNHPNCKIILSHAGGTLPYLVQRVANIAPYLPRSAGPKSGQEVLEDAKSFYFDLALSSSNVVLGALLNFAPHDHILYGSDFPYAPVPCITSFSDDLEAYPMEQSLRDKLNFVNALALFPRLNKSA